MSVNTGQVSKRKMVAVKACLPKPEYISQVNGPFNINSTLPELQKVVSSYANILGLFALVQSYLLDLFHIRHLNWSKQEKSWCD